MRRRACMRTIPGMIRDKSDKDQDKLAKGVIAVAPPLLTAAMSGR